jgi:exodeoxyribonuclease V gamma subunit
MIQSGFMVLQSNRLENLRRVTVEWLRRNPLEPLENDVILVQSNGVAQWLKIALARDSDDTDEAGCGIAAALNIDLPGRFHWQAYRAVLGNLPKTSPYDKPLLTWRLLRLLPDLLDEPRFASLRHFLAEDHSQRKLFQLAQRLADLLDQYQIYRADWLNDWSAGKDQFTRNNQHQGLPDSQQWQAELWRRVQADIPDSQRHNGRARIHADFLQACQSGLSPDSHSLPRRVIVFGLSSLPRQTLEVLAAIANVSQILLCVQNPSEQYWGDTIDTLSDHGNALLAAWGRQGRDYLRLLAEHDERSAYEQLFAANKLTLDLFDAPDESSLLGQLHADIFHLRSRAEITGLAPPAPDDRSISFHIAHSRQREVEILQDHLLDLMAASPDLHPRDILVMVPDINQFAPHIQAVFGRLRPDDSRYLPFTVSDQGHTHRAQIYQALEMLLSLHRSRFSVSELLDLLDIHAIQRAFGLKTADHNLLHNWVAGAGIRWGLDGRQRLQQELLLSDEPAVLDQNTWQFGLRRMLLGYAAGRSDAWQDIEPYDEVSGLDAALVGTISHILQRLAHYRELFMQPTNVEQWTQRITQLIREFFDPQDDREQVLLSRAEQKLQQWLEQCDEADFHDDLPIEVVSDFFLSALDAPDLNQRFLAGTINFATLMPMRAIPFRHICLLGMNDGEYPRQVAAVDFDLMRHDYRAGDRSRREDDRYLFLEAMLSARESLYISWAGRNIRDNSERPPSVLVAQLRDYLSQRCDVHTLTRSYPLQPFSHRYFTAGSPWYTYAHEWQGNSPAHATHASQPDIRMPLSAGTEPTDEAIKLRQLSALLKNPAAVYFEQALGTVFRDAKTDAEDDECFDINGLQRWQLQNQMINETVLRLTKPDTEALTVESLLENAMLRLQRQGQLPLAGFAALQHRNLIDPLIRPLQRYQRLVGEYTVRSEDQIDITLPDSTFSLSDRLSDILSNDNGERIRIEMISGQIWDGSGSGKKAASIKWHYLARLWPAHLAAQLVGPTRTHILGPDTHQVALPPMDTQRASDLLSGLLTLWQQNLEQPLASAVKTGCSWLTADNQDTPSKAIGQYEGNFGSTGEMQSSYALYRLWPDFEALQAAGFQQASLRLYEPMVKFWHQYRQEADA